MQIPITSEFRDVSKTNSMSVLEVSDPKVCIMAHLMTPLEPLDPALESPMAHPLMRQRTAASELLTEVSFLMFVQLPSTYSLEIQFPVVWFLLFCVCQIQHANIGASGGMLLANMERCGELISSILLLFMTVTTSSIFQPNFPSSSTTRSTQRRRIHSHSSRLWGTHRCKSSSQKPHAIRLHIRSISTRRLRALHDRLCY